MDFLPGIGTTEMLIVGIIALMLFGKNLPKVGRDLGRTFAEFKRGGSEFHRDIRFLSGFCTNEMLIICVVGILLLILLFLNLSNDPLGQSF